MVTLEGYHNFPLVVHKDLLVSRYLKFNQEVSNRKHPNKITLMTNCDNIHIYLHRCSFNLM